MTVSIRDIAVMTPFGGEDRQRRRQCVLSYKRVQHIVENLVEVDEKYADEIREKTEQAQKNYFLREQIKIIRRELGEEKDVRQEELSRFESSG